jgi:hypothetical protein
MRPSGMERPTTGLSQQSGEAGGSLSPETRARVGAAPTTTGRVGTARRSGSGKQDGTVQVGLNQWWNPLKRRTPARTWRIWAGQQQCARRSSRRADPVGPTRRRPRRKPAAYPRSWLQGKSWAPPPSIGREVNVGTSPKRPSPVTSLVAGGQARRRLSASGWGGVRAVVGGWESQPQGEGGQRSRSDGDCRAGGRR